MTKVGSHINMLGTQLQGALLEPLAAAPATYLIAGRMYYDTALGAPRWYDGAAFSNKATDSILHGGQTLAYVLSRANSTGTQLAATISDFDTQVRTSRLDQLAAPTLPVAFGGQRITNLADPTADTEAATRGYVIAQVQANAAGIDSKPSVRIVLTANDTLSGLAARDGVTPVAGDRVLAAAQTTGAQNGPYIASSGAWIRAADGDQQGEITPGALWYVEEGTANGVTQWRVQNTGTITLGTTAISIVKFNAGQVYTGSLGVQLVGSDFRAAVIASGGILAQAGGLTIDTSIVVRMAKGPMGTNGATFTPTFVHNLGTQDVDVTVRDATTQEYVIVHWVATDTNTITFTFNTPTAPATGAYRVLVTG